jgi:integrase
MTSARLKYVQRAGVGRYCYARFPNCDRVRLRGVEGSPEFLRDYEQARIAAENKRGAPAPALTVPTTPTRVAFLPGSLSWVATQYLESRTFRDLAEETKTVYRRQIDKLRTDMGAGLIADLRRSHVTQYSAAIAKKHGNATGDAMIRKISILWQFALGLKQANIDDDATNPTKNVKLQYRVKKPHAPWPEEIQRRFLEGAPDYAKLAFYLMLYTAQRRGDVVAMKWSDYDSATKRILVVQEKTGNSVPLRAHARLAELLAQTPRVSDRICTNYFKKPYSKGGLTHLIVARLREVGVDPNQYTLHGLRKTAGVKLAEAGATVDQIMKVLGHSSPAQALWYTREASKQKLIDDAMDKWEAA